MSASIRDIVRIAAAKSRDGGLPLPRQLLEMAFLLLRHRVGPGYYLMARCWRASMPWSEKVGHWNGDRYLRFVQRINKPAYFKISQHKLVEKSLLQSLHLPTAALLGYFHPRKGQATDGAPLTTATELAALLAAMAPAEWFIKPAEGDSGRGVFAIATQRGPQGELRILDAGSAAPLSIDRLAQRLAAEAEGCVIERRIRQHADVAAFNPSSVNTLRIWVLDDGGQIRVVGAFLRVGRAGSIVDNTSQGGLSCAIDLDSGRIRLALDQTLARNEYLRHPDTDALLVGAQIPCWPQCVALAVNALRVLPGTCFVGMDVAVSTDGPVVVEYNVEPNHRGAAQFDLSHARIFAGLTPARA